MKDFRQLQQGEEWTKVGLRDQQGIVVPASVVVSEIADITTGSFPMRMATYRLMHGDQYCGYVQLLCPADNWQYKKGPEFFDGQPIGYVQDVVRARQSPFRGVGLQAVALALTAAGQAGLGEKVGLEACYGSGKFWLQAGLRPCRDITDEDLIKMSKSDGANHTEMYLPPENVAAFLQRIKEDYSLPKNH